MSNVVSETQFGKEIIDQILIRQDQPLNFPFKKPLLSQTNKN